MIKAIATYADGSVTQVELVSCTKNGATSFKILTELDYKKIMHIDFLANDMECEAGQEGYILISAHIHCQKEMEDYGLCYFKEREDREFVSGILRAPLTAIKKQDKAVLLVAKTMAVCAKQVINIKNNVYTTSLRISINCSDIYEEIEVLAFDLKGKDSTYSGIAKAYRNYQLKYNGFKLIKDRLTPQLKFGAKSIYVRIRLGWKPVPSPVAEQTIENEPPMYTACTFKQVQKLIEAYYEAGMRNVEFCLVGWNIKGHDGRWPQAFPVEKDLGGEEDLIALIKRAKELGFEISAHSNLTDAFAIADIFKLDDMCMQKNGSYHSVTAWAGGRSYDLCAKRAYEIAKDNLPKIKELGFGGLNYIDVITCVSPKSCYHPEHQLNPKEWEEYWCEIFKLSKELFGGTSSEGSADYCLRDADYALYSSFSRKANHDTWDLFDQQVPFWQIVYHGIVLYNSYSETVNAPMNKDKRYMLKSFELGDRPSNYYFSKFKSDGKNWMGDKDFRCGNAEEIKEAIKASRKQYEMFQKLSYLQTVLIDEHLCLEENIYVTKYEDGSVVTANYNDFSLTLENFQEKITFNI